MAGAAIIANYRATQAERRHPALGRFVTAGGARLHYIEQGRDRRWSFCTAAASLVVLLVWVYYSAQIVLFGAEITHVLGGRSPGSSDLRGTGNQAQPKPL